MHMTCSGVGVLDDRWSGNAHLGGRKGEEKRERWREEWEGKRNSPRVSWRTQIAAIQTDRQKWHHWYMFLLSIYRHITTKGEYAGKIHATKHKQWSEHMAFNCPLIAAREP